MKNKDYSSLWMFLLGLGASTKIYLGGVVALSELAVFAIAPYILLRHYPKYKKWKFMPILWLSLLMIPGCFIACRVNNVYWLWFVKSAMQSYSIFAGVVVFCFVLTKRLKGIGWFYMGLILSMIISVFILNPQVAADERSTELIGDIGLREKMEGALFWYPKIGQLLKLPVNGWYFETPIIYSILAPIAVAFASVVTSVSGRSAAAMSLLSFALIIYCRKSRKRMRTIGRHCILFSLLGCAVVVGIKNLYVYTASTGLLGDEARAKYYGQTRGDDSFLRIMISGRTEFFIAIRALIDNPIIGIGPRAEDTKGYVKEFMVKYGTQEDFDIYLRRIAMSPCDAELIPQHSMFTQFWGYSGISGLAFCLYILYLIYVYFRRYMQCIPQWFGYFSLMIPSFMFTLFFNPYSERVTYPLLISCLLIVRAVGEGKLQLPYEMEMEARKHV